ncbi:hypothetical protein BSKO_07092 [Bryopsis sp. KO-2023]|nr:hypothetical protein BSKO_07092 [Bryopsis sp. KO-2023]
MDDEGKTLIANADDLEALANLPPSERQLTDELNGVIVETALTGRLRYEWRLIKPLIALRIKRLLHDYDATEKVEIGPPRPFPFGDTLEGCYDVLVGHLEALSGAPFTIQRLCEVVLEPQKQYSRLDKVVVAIEKLLLVTITVPVMEELPERPLVSSFAAVNENPPKQKGGEKPDRANLPFTVRPMGAVPDGRCGQGEENHPTNNAIISVQETGLVSSALAVVTSAPSNETQHPGSGE